jgi:hypothetical protein
MKKPRRNYPKEEERKRKGGKEKKEGWEKEEDWEKKEGWKKKEIDGKDGVERN